MEMRRYLSGDLESAGRHMRHGIEKSKFVKGLLKVIGVLAVSMVMSDGVLTPAQSVLGAVQGIEVVDPGISKSTIVGTTAGILILLFAVQPFGTTKIASTFAPIVIIWLAFNAIFGIYNLSKFDASVLRAFNPAYGFEYLIRYKTQGWKSLGGILLAFTGVEALFADLGAFSRQAIQLSWLCYTYPCLLLAYIGQAAYISVHPEAYSNPFFKAAPPGTIYPSLVIAILAAVVASQAIITATFQVCAFHSFIKVLADSELAHGPDHEVILFPTDQGRAYVKNIPWTAICTNGQLAIDDWYCIGSNNLQQCMLLLLPSSASANLIFLDNIAGKRVWSMRYVRHVLRHLHGLARRYVCLEN